MKSSKLLQFTVLVLFLTLLCGFVAYEARWMPAGVYSDPVAFLSGDSTSTEVPDTVMVQVSPFSSSKVAILSPILIAPSVGKEKQKDVARSVGWMMTKMNDMRRGLAYRSENNPALIRDSLIRLFELDTSRYVVEADEHAYFKVLPMNYEDLSPAEREAWLLSSEQQFVLPAFRTAKDSQTWEAYWYHKTRSGNDFDDRYLWTPR